MPFPSYLSFKKDKPVGLKIQHNKKMVIRNPRNLDVVISVVFCYVRENKSIFSTIFQMKITNEKFLIVEFTEIIASVPYVLHERYII